MSEAPTPAPKPVKKNTSLQAKSSARLAAAQLLYRVAVTGEAFNAAKLARDYQHYLDENKHAPAEAKLPAIAPNAAYLRKLLEGVGAHAEALEALVDAHLSEKWKRERMSPLLVAILKLGLFELDAHRNLPTGVLVDEYTALAARFVDEEEVSFVHAVMAKAAREMRT